MNYLTLDEVKKCELDILKYIDYICTQNNLKYFLSFGTLIGAVRHKGFIPWDDDIDISMPREDYEKLILIMQKQEDERYKVLSYRTKKYPYPFIKVTDSYTKIEDDGVVDYPYKGLWIDIFPIDGFKSQRRSILSKVTIFIEHMRSLASYKRLPDRHKKRKWIRCISKLFGYRFFLYLIERISYNKRFYTNPYAGVYYAPVKILPKSVYGNGVKAQFENMTFTIPSDYDAFLKEEYGDYMKLPPKELQISHCVKAYYIKK